VGSMCIQSIKCSMTYRYPLNDVGLLTLNLKRKKTTFSLLSLKKIGKYKGKLLT